MVHYIPLKKDFSNLDHGDRADRDPDVRRELTENAHRDLIASGHWSYRRFVNGVDDVLSGAGVSGRVDAQTVSRVHSALGRRSRLRRLRRVASWNARRLLRIPAARRVVRFGHPVTSRIRRRLRATGPVSSPEPEVRRYRPRA